MQKLVDAVKELLNNRQHLDLHEDDRRMLQEALPTEADPDLHGRAREIYQKGWGPFADEIEIDDVAYTSASDEGTWVSAWVWVPKDEEDDDEEHQP